MCQIISSEIVIIALEPLDEKTMLSSPQRALIFPPPFAISLLSRIFHALLQVNY